MGQALYRKYRPKTLGEIVGQEHVTTTLSNALKAGRISHAYLLTGPRGVGKTSIARILAHEINDLPYEDEAHLDIIEIDAASNRRIDEIRDLRDRVNTAPASAKYKVYIIDEVHMLTKEAFNALLKTLEEPPAHVVFILATTEAHKLPETIISRTQRYSLRPVPEEQVVAHLREIATGEKLQVDDAALAIIAHHGEGSFRDSISLLDQASSSAEHVTSADIERILGLAPDAYIAQLSSALTTGASNTVVSTLAELYGQGYEPAMIASQLSATLRSAVLNGVSTDPGASLQLLQNLLDVPAARSPRQLLELVLLQSALPPAAPDTPAPQVASAAPTAISETTAQPVVTPATKPLDSPLVKSGASAPDAITQKSAAPQSNTVIAPAASPDPSPSPVAQLAATPPEASTVVISTGAEGETAPSSDQATSSEQTVPSEAVPTDDPAVTAAADKPTTNFETPQLDATELWQQTLDIIKKQYNTLYGIARMAKPEFNGQQLTLSLKFAFHQKRINEAKNRKIISDAFEQIYGQPVEIVCVIAEPSATDSAVKPDVSAISNIFGGAELLES